MEFFEDGHLELYNLKDDIGEKNNLAGKMPEKAGELHKMMREWREQTGAKMPGPNQPTAPSTSKKKKQRAAER